MSLFLPIHQGEQGPGAVQPKEGNGLRTSRPGGDAGRSPNCQRSLQEQVSLTLPEAPLRPHSLVGETGSRRAVFSRVPCLPAAPSFWGKGTLAHGAVGPCLGLWCELYTCSVGLLTCRAKLLTQNKTKTLSHLDTRSLVLINPKHPGYQLACFF